MTPLTHGVVRALLFSLSMTRRHALARVIFGLLLPLAMLGLPACSQSHGPTGEGVCCPVTSFSGCSPGSVPLPAGGWAPSAASCTDTIEGFDGPPWVHVIDERGCERVEEDWSAPWCGVVLVDAGPPNDAGPPPPWDAGPPWVDAGGTGCDGLGPAQCLQQGCLPTFEDACCPSCSEEPCADCLHWTYYACRPPGHACSSASCSSTSPWACAGGPPDCSAAHVNADDACDIAGCVPAYPSGTGEPDPLVATCVPIHAQVCTVACRRLAPPCPSGTVAEGDGSCYTDRCIPAFVCE